MGKKEQENRKNIIEGQARRSFALGVFNGAAFNIAEALIDPPLVLTWFVSQLTPSNLLAGLVSPLGKAGWFLPQIFISARVQRMKHKMPSYTLAAVIRVVVWLALAAAVWFMENPLLLLVSFFVLYSVARLSSGLAGLAFFDVVAKTIPTQRRGKFFAWRQFLGGSLGLGAGWVVKMVLSHPAFPFPRGHALLFFLYCAAAIPGLIAFISIREPAGATVREPTTLGTQLRRAKRILQENHVYRRYLMARMSLALAGIALPFYGVYAQRALKAPEWMVGTYVTARIGATLLFNLPWGRLSDLYGNRLVMRLLNLGSGATALLALILVGVMAFLHPQWDWLPYLALPLFFLNGAMRPGQVLAGSNFLLELVQEAERPLYLGLSNTLMGLVILLSGLGGLVVDVFGFASLFAVSFGLCLVGYTLATGLPEPREKEG